MTSSSGCQGQVHSTAESSSTIIKGYKPLKETKTEDVWWQKNERRWWYCKTVGISACRTVGISACWTVGISACWTVATHSNVPELEIKGTSYKCYSLTLFYNLLNTPFSNEWRSGIVHFCRRLSLFTYSGTPPKGHLWNEDTFEMRTPPWSGHLTKSQLHINMYYFPLKWKRLPNQFRGPNGVCIRGFPL